MKKICKHIMLVSSLLLVVNIPSYAKEVNETVDMNDGMSYYIQSDGKKTNTTTTDSDTQKNSTKTNSVTYTSAEKNAMNKKQNIRNILNDWIEQIKNDPSYADQFYSNSNHDTANLAMSNISCKDVAQLVSVVKDYSKSTDAKSGAAWVNSNDKPVDLTTDDSSDIKNLNDKEIQEIKKEIVKNETGKENIISNNPKSMYGFDIKFSLDSILSTPQDGDAYDFSHYINTGKIVQRYLYSGAPALKDTDYYSDRFNGLSSRAKDNDWGSTTSVYMDDSVTISLLTDYHIYSVKKDFVTNTNYLDDKRKWTVYLDDKQVGEPIVTDDPRHEINFTDIYKKNGAGKYKVVAEQIANVTKATYVSYDICEYLFETNTGNILYYKQSLARGSAGGSIYLGTETSKEWVETGDTFYLTVNNLEDIEKDGNATQRTE